MARALVVDICLLQNNGGLTSGTRLQVHGQVQTYLVLRLQQKRDGHKLRVHDFHILYARIHIFSLTH